MKPLLTTLQKVYQEGLHCVMCTCDKTSTGFFRSILAIPISPLASPLPSTMATHHTVFTITRWYGHTDSPTILALLLAAGVLEVHMVAGV